VILAFDRYGLERMGDNLEQLIIMGYVVKEEVVSETDD
jgi:hypothetical protein